MHFKPRWLAYIIGAMVGLVTIKNVLGWNGDLTAIIGALSVALGMGLNHLFGESRGPPEGEPGET